MVRQQRQEMHPSDDEASRDLKNTKESGITTDLSPAAQQVLQSMNVAELAEQYVRLAADFDNFRRRTALEFDERRRLGIATAVTALLPTVDDIERATTLARSDSGHTSPALLNGLEMVLKNLDAALEKLGIEPIATTDALFDPSIHEAIMSEPSATVDHETVIAELQRGYRYKDQVLRPALVRVAVPEGEPPVPVSTPAPINE